MLNVLFVLLTYSESYEFYIQYFSIIATSTHFWHFYTYSSSFNMDSNVLVTLMQENCITASGSKGHQLLAA